MRWQFTLNPATDNKVIAEPVGWAEIEFAFVRSREWHGVFTEYSLPLKFYNDPQDSTKDAFDFLEAEYEADGVDGSVILKVELACDDDDAFTEEGQWKLNFTSYKRYIGESCLIELNMEPDSCLMTFKSRYDQKVNLDTTETFDGTALTPYDKLNFEISLEPKAVPFQSILRWQQPVLGTEVAEYTETDTIPLGTGNETRDVEVWFSVGFNIIEKDEVTTRLYDAAAYATALGSVAALYDIEYSGDYEITIDRGNSAVLGATASATINVITEANNSDCNIDDAFDQEMTVELFLDAGGTVVSLFSDTEVNFCDSVGGKNMTITPAVYSNTFTLTAGDTIKFYARVYGKGKWDRNLISNKDVDWTVSFFETQIGLKITVKTTTAATTCDVFAINETGSRILEAITDDCYRMLSSYYGRTDSEPYLSPDNADGCGSLRVFTTGLHIRRFPRAEFTMSFKDFFEGLNPIDNIGLGLEEYNDGYGLQDVVRVEPMAYFYDDTTLVQLDKVPYATVTVIPEEHISIYKFGYQKWEAEEYTGLDEFATKREYRTSLQSLKNTLEKVSYLIASGYAIEITRWNSAFDPATIEDWRFDNDDFIICCKRSSGEFVVEQGNITDDANLYDPPTVYNFRISPGRNALRWLKTVLNSYKDPEAATSTIEFTAGEGNYIAKGLMTGACVEENAALNENDTLGISNVADPADGRPIYEPELWDFEFPLSFSEYNTIKANPTQVIQARFRAEASYRDFFIREIHYKPNEGKAQFMLLPKRSFPIDDCLFYIVQQRGADSDIFGSTVLIGALLENLFVFVNGELMKYNDANPANNEIDTWDDTTGYGTLTFPIPEGQQVTIIHIPPQDLHCSLCIHRFEGRGDGSTSVTLTGFGSATLAQMWVFYNGQLMKYSDLVAANNELVSYTGATEELLFAGTTNANRELRVFAFTQTCCSDVFNGHGDGTSAVQLSGIGDATLANLFVFYNGNLAKYNDSDTSNNEIVSYDIATQTATLNNTLHPDRELRALNIENC